MAIVTARPSQYVPEPLPWTGVGGSWRIDLTLWLHNAHLNVTRWHEEPRERITADQCRADLRIKDAWHRRPGYPDQVGGLDIYTAVIDDGVPAPPIR